MSQYFTRVFCQILESSIAEDYVLRHVFEDFLKVADWRTGIVDATRESLSRKFNIPLDLLNKKIDLLEKPDPHSRDQADEGRRLRRLDAHRNWGWQIVNWEKYADKKRQIDGAIRVAKHRAKQAELFANDASTTVEPPSQPSVEDACLKIYDAYPRKVSKKAAFKAIRNALNKTTSDFLFERVTIFAKAVEGADMKFVPHPATWFNQERYNDDPKEWSTYGNNGKNSGQPPQTINRAIGTANERVAERYRTLDLEQLAKARASKGR